MRVSHSKNVGDNVVVAKDGSGDYTTITEAVKMVPNGTREGKKWLILVRAWVYGENVDEVGIKKTNIMLMGKGGNREDCDHKEQECCGWILHLQLFNTT
ncbi:hypothetical protein AMTR_s00076p00183030 [Amborella trichopoda]|uniref:Pectinesterase catalytic domain-containing protein n=1 Tax=Amborella trichopoda TaxID=13333 RepID=W1PCG6_AMBTC|nr:hypothetical protein AMTR_s00076p00183030 [Amborella trichopoda]